MVVLLLLKCSNASAQEFKHLVAVWLVHLVLVGASPLSAFSFHITEVVVQRRLRLLKLKAAAFVVARVVTTMTHMGHNIIVKDRLINNRHICSFGYYHVFLI